MNLFTNEHKDTSKLFRIRCYFLRNTIAIYLLLSFLSFLFVLFFLTLLYATLLKTWRYDFLCLSVCTFTSSSAVLFSSKLQFLSRLLLQFSQLLLYPYFCSHSAMTYFRFLLSIFTYPTYMSFPPLLCIAFHTFFHICTSLINFCARSSRRLSTTSVTAPFETQGSKDVAAKIIRQRNDKLTKNICHQIKVSIKIICP